MVGIVLDQEETVKDGVSFLDCIPECPYRGFSHNVKPNMLMQSRIALEQFKSGHGGVSSVLRKVLPGLHVGTDGDLRDSKG